MRMGCVNLVSISEYSSCTVENDITLLDSWIISAEGQFSKKADLFPRKFSINLNGCPMKASGRDRGRFLIRYIEMTRSKREICHENILPCNGFTDDGFAKLKMTFIHVHAPEGFEIENVLTTNLNGAMIGVLYERDLYCVR